MKTKWRQFGDYYRQNGDNMDFPDGIRTFVAVVETRSFTAAARRLGISNKLTSKYIAALEARLGHQLMYRTTRSLSLTEYGERWLPYARAALRALDEAESALADAGEGLSGRLRITGGTTFGELCLSDAAYVFISKYPDVRVDLVLSDGFVDLAAGGFDLAVRIGIPKDSSYRMKRVGETTPRIAASSDYLAEYGIPEHPDDLCRHHAILDLSEEVPGRWPFKDGPKEITRTIQGRLAVNSATAAIRQAIAGRGLVRAPDVFLDPYLQRGDLVQVLEAFATGARPIHLLTNPSEFHNSKIKAFESVLQKHLAHVR